MIFNLIIIGLVVICFVLKIGNFFVFANLPNLDYRQAKELLAICFAVAIIMVVLYRHGLKPIKNKLILSLVAFLTIHKFIIAPKFTMVIFEKDVGGFWQYQPIMEIWIYFLLACAIFSTPINSEKIDKFLKTILWIGIFTSGYAIFQWVGQDNTQSLIQKNYALTTTAGALSTTFTQPNFTGLFLALALPVALHFRKYWAIALIAFVIYLTHSQMAYMVAGIATWVYIFLASPSNLRIILGFVTGCIAVGFIIAADVLDLWSVIFQSSGRFEVWKMLIDDVVNGTMIKQPGVLLTGHGLGVFGMFFRTQHNSVFDCAHNEYLQLFFDAGILGPILLVLAIVSIIFAALQYLKDHQELLLISIFIGICLSATLIFTWQTQPFKFLTCVIVGIILRKIYDRKASQNGI